MRLVFAILLILFATLTFAQDVMESDLSDQEKIVELRKLLQMNPRNSDLHNNIGVIYAGQQNWPLARDAFLVAVQCDPRNADTHKNFAQVLVYLEQYDLAIAEFEAYRKFSTNGALDAARMIGDTWMAAGDPALARASYRNGLELFGEAFLPETAHLVLLLANLMEKNGEMSKRQTLLEKYVDSASKLDDPASSNIVVLTLRLIYENAELLSESGLHADAAKLYKRAIEIAPENDELLPKLSISLLESGEVIEAKVVARQAVTEHPEKAGGWRAEGLIAEKEGRVRDAAEAFIKAQDIEPKTDLAVKIGELYLSIGDTRNARLYMSQLVNEDDAPPEALYNYALSLQREDLWEISVMPLRKAVEKDPSLEPAWRALATSLRKTKRFSEAADAYEKVITFGDDKLQWFLFGWSLVKADRVADGIEAYRKAIEIDPLYAKAQYNLALALISLENHEEALEILEVSRELEDNSYRVLFNMGVCCYALEEYDRSIELYDLALEQKETSAAWNNVGLAYLALGDKKEANNCFKTAKGMK